MLKRIYIILFFVSVSGLCLAQQTGVPGELTVVQNKSLSYNYTKAEDLLTTQLIDNAFEIKLSSGTVNLNTYAQLRVTGRNANSIMANKLALRLGYKNAPGTAINTSEILLSNTPVLLFTQPGNLTRATTYTYMYDLIIKPFTTFIKPDSYNFSIIFTVTPE